METGSDDRANPLGWGKADEEVRDPDVAENVEEGQIREPGQPPEYDIEHQGEERERGA